MNCGKSNAHGLCLRICSSDRDGGDYVPCLSVDKDGVRHVAERKLIQPPRNRPIRRRYRPTVRQQTEGLTRGDPDRRCDQVAERSGSAAGLQRLCTRNASQASRRMPSVMRPDRKLVHLAAERATDPQRFRPRRAEALDAGREADGRSLLDVWQV